MTKPMGQMGRNELEARIRELEAENARLRKQHDEAIKVVWGYLAKEAEEAGIPAERIEAAGRVNEYSMGVLAPFNACTLPGCQDKAFAEPPPADLLRPWQPKFER
jgi:hypothetical protein